MNRTTSGCVCALLLAVCWTVPLIGHDSNVVPLICGQTTNEGYRVRAMATQRLGTSLAATTFRHCTRSCRPACQRIPGFRPMRWQASRTTC